MKHIRHIFAALLLLVGMESAVLAQEYNFAIPKADITVTIEPEGSALIHYKLLFKCSPGAHAIDIVDIGMPSGMHEAISASIDGDLVNPSKIKKSSYVSNGYEVHLGTATIYPNTSGLFEFVGRSKNMVWQDTTKKNMASFRFSPTWFGSKYVTGTTELTLRYKLPPGNYPDPDRTILWHKNTPPFQLKGIVAGEAVPSVVWTQTIKMTGPHKFGVSFPKAYVQKVEHITTYGLFLRWVEDNPGIGFASGVFLLIVFTVLYQWATKLTGWVLWIVGLLVLSFGLVNSVTFHLALYPCLFLLWAVIWRFKRSSKKSYIPASISKEGGKVSSRLTPVEAALLTDHPVNKIIALLTFDMMKRGLLTLISEKPLKVEVVGKKAGHNKWDLPDGRRRNLDAYEYKFLNAVEDNAKVPLEQINLEEVMNQLIRCVTGKVKGCDLDRTRKYCRFKSEHAWKKMKEETDFDLKTKCADENHGWLAIADDSEENWSYLESDYGYYYRPHWYHCSTGGYHHPPAATGLPVAPIPAGPSSSPSSSFSDVFHSFTGQLEGIGDKMVDLPINVSKGIDLSGFDEIVGDSIVSGGGGYSGGGGGCACACAGCACACACAGGGR